MAAYNAWTGGLLALVLVLIVAWKSGASEILKDFSDVKPAPYSFSRSQLAWWTTIIGLCIALHFALTGQYPTFNKDDTALILLGISAGTTGVATILDQRQDQASAVSGVPRSQDSKSQGWLNDVLSDNYGPSVHRLQALVFNGIYGVLYIATFLSNPGYTMPTFDGPTLALLGISASAYGFMKSTENQGPAAVSAAASEAPSNPDPEDSGWVG